MHVRSTVAILVAAAAATAAVRVATQAPAPAAVPFTVHEWGTFTSIAGEDGQAVKWLPQAGASDLPCFVERSFIVFKLGQAGTVRMETPVLYFYAPSDVTVDVKVGFRQGLITEWYPHAAVGVVPGLRDYDGTIDWRGVRVSPSIAAEFPVEGAPSHYYKARETDATPLQVSTQKDRFLFYRGVGQFAPPISATTDADGKTVIWSTHGEPLGDVILFENRRGVVSYSVQHVSAGRTSFDRPMLDDESTPPKRELVSILMANGLYRKEAEAMVATWSDSWFEEGARLFYVVPRSAVDTIVPLAIAPAPSEIARVFVGRLELVTAETRREVHDALVANDGATLATYGRFLRPIGDRVIAASAPAERALLEDRLHTAAAPWTAPPTTSSCRR